ncbi:preprotein translocase subunit SecE [Planctomicrobium sp. SH668]|uniref:preprotein translocase subunit SecE n=1 Tax=Planctomicrobium sp. SH668 TaxID=3448126 RepID=UPI003F5C6C57
MAKAKAEASLVGELFQGRLFKPTQGRIVRQITALAVAGFFVAIAWRMHVTILSDIQDVFRLGVPGTALGFDIPGWIVRNGLPGVIAAAGCWFAFRLVNWPEFANFLISVEAEMDKVTWATWEYLYRATIVVLVVMLFLGGYLFLCDILWQQLFAFVGFLDLQ